METIAHSIRTMFRNIVRDELRSLERRVKTLAKAELFDEQLRVELVQAHEHLVAALQRTDELGDAQ